MSDKTKKEDNLQVENENISAETAGTEETAEVKDESQASSDNESINKEAEKADMEDSFEEDAKDDAKKDFSKKEQTSSDSTGPSFSDYNQAYQDIYDEILERFRGFSPSEEIASKITEEHITEYLEGNREMRLQEFKERREKRFLSALEILAVLTTIILIVYFLSDNAAILVNILYIIGGLLALWIWKGKGPGRML